MKIHVYPGLEQTLDSFFVLWFPAKRLNPGRITVLCNENRLYKGATRPNKSVSRDGVTTGEFLTTPDWTG